MAEYNQLLAQRFNRLATALFGLEEAPGIGSVGPELLPTVTMEGDRFENGHLKGELHLICRMVVAGGVGTRPHFALTIPRGAGRVFVVEGFRASSTFANDLVDVGEFGTAVPLATAEFAFSRDPRGLPVPSAAFAGRFSSVVLAIGALMQFDTLLLPTVGVQQESGPNPYYVVSPGNGLLWRSGLDNQTVTLIVWGYERPARPEEL